MLKKIMDFFLYPLFCALQERYPLRAPIRYGFSGSLINDQELPYTSVDILSRAGRFPKEVTMDQDEKINKIIEIFKKCKETSIEVAASETFSMLLFKAVVSVAFPEIKKFD